MIKDIISQVGSAQKVLLSLNVKRLSFVYLVIALNKALQEKNITLKIYCQNSEIKNELLNIDPFIMDKFVENVEKTTYSLRLKNSAEVVEKFNNSFTDQELSVEFESNDSDISLKDFEFKKNSQDFDVALWFGDISDKQIEELDNIKTIKHSYFFDLKRENKSNNLKNHIFLNGTHIQFFFDLLNGIEINSKKEIFTYLLTSILLETNNLTNNKTIHLLELVTRAIEKGGVFYIAQNYLAQNKIQDINLIGNILIRTREVAKNVFYCEIPENFSITSSNIIEQVIGVLKKLKGHKIIILKTSYQFKTTYYIASTHSRIDLNILKKRFPGSGYKNYFKFSSKENTQNIIKYILDIFSLEHSITEINTAKETKVEQKPVNELKLEYIENENNRGNNFENVPVNKNFQDPLKPAIEIPEPLNFFKKQIESKPQSNTPLPTAS